ncbi:hypothetical protein HXX76_006901 [Chlamydomonas incerta]|uniref:glucose-1-phosphate adenylyltransferase n=1 Tax=Chlamydomonas incerta TaxID=51695 RepID=A0A835W048_CHLIN|nr:hypothetical protein HXX76_006901 [Chlamydomonas incerta]|eukprot:KAG2435702.1 hypothetical protein HXX76_006901 [Chlamydomonas incerta]
MKQLQQFQERWSGDMGGASGSSGLGSAGGAAVPWSGLGEHSGSFGDPELSRSSLSIWPRGNLTAVVLGGGESDSRRLFPLTQYRTLPALPFGGAYRIIDLLMSNMLNSGINKIHILTAYNSYSLNRHLQRTYDMSGGVPYGGDGYIEVVSNSMSPDSQQWVTGTAGCVRQFMSYFDSNSKNRFIEDIMILPGDHVYSADYTPIIAYHRSTGADLTIVCRPVSGEQASRLGIVKLDAQNRIKTFSEKPSAAELPDLAMSDDEMRPFMTPTEEALRQQTRRRQQTTLASGNASGPLGRLAPGAAKGGARMGGGGGGRVVLDTMTSVDESETRPGTSGYVGSCGIYIFRRSVLSEALKRHYKMHDFGRQIIPELIREGAKVHAYRLPGYWADVGGSVGDFYSANMALLSDPPSISFNAPINSPFFKFPLTIPASQMMHSRVSGALVSAGCIINGSQIRNSVVGSRSIIGPNVTIEDSVVFGASHYDHEKPLPRPLGPTFPPMGVGEGSVVRNAILDLNVRVGKNVQLVNKEGVYESADRGVQGMYVRDGIIVLARETVVPDGTIM